MIRPKVFQYHNGNKITIFMHGCSDLFLTPIQRFHKGVRKVLHLADELHIPKENRQRNRFARHLAGKIFSDFMEMLGNDMIDDHTIFVLPMPNAGWLYITDLVPLQKNEKKFYNIKTGGTYYVPMLHRGSRMNHTGAFYYITRFNRKLRNKLYNKILAGEKYIP